MDLTLVTRSPPRAGVRAWLGGLRLGRGRGGRRRQHLALAREQPHAGREAGDAGPLRGGQAGVALVGQRDVARAQEVEAEADRRVHRGEETDHATGNARAARVEKQHDRDDDREQQLVEAEVVARAFRVADGEEETGVEARVVVRGETAGAPEDPADDQTQRHRVGVGQGRDLFLAREIDERQRRSEKAAERRQSRPDVQQHQGVFANPLGEIEDHRDQVGHDEAAEDDADVEELHVLRVETALRALLDDDGVADDDADRDQQAEHVDRLAGDASGSQCGRSNEVPVEVRDHAVLVGASRSASTMSRWPSAW